MNFKQVVGSLAVAMTLASCGVVLGPTPTPPSQEYAWQHPRNACELAITRFPLPAQELAADALQPVFSSCSLDEMVAARDYLLLDLVDPRGYASEQCPRFPSLAETRLCQDAQGDS